MPKTALITRCDERAVEGTLPLSNELSDLLSLTDKVDKDSPLSDVESASLSIKIQQKQLSCDTSNSYT